MNTKAWIALSAALLLLAGAGTYIVRQQSQAEFAAAHTLAETELSLFASLVSDALDRGDFHSVHVIVQRWVRKDADVALLRVRDTGGTLLGEQVRRAPAKHPLAFDMKIRYGERDEARIEFVKDLAPVVAAQSRLVTQLSGIFVVLALLLAALTRLTLLHRQARLRLEARDELLRRLSARVPGVIYQFRMYPDGRTCFPYASDGIRTIYEVAPDEVNTDATPVFGRLHPEDLDAVAASIRTSFETLGPWRQVYRVVLPERGVRWLRGESMPERLADGSVLWHGYITDATEFVEARRNLEESEQRYRVQFEHAPEAIVVFDADAGRFIDANGNAERLFGLARDELLSRSPLDLSPALQPDGLPSAQVAPARIGAALDGAAPVFEWTHLDAAGRAIPCEIRLVRLPASGRNLVRGSISDITERKRAEAAVRSSEAIMRATFDHAPVGILHTGYDDDRILDANPKLCSMLGYTRDELRAMATGQLIRPELFGSDRVNYEGPMRRGEIGSHSADRPYRCKDGSDLWVRRTVSIARDQTGKPLFYVRIVEDITERRAAAEAVRASEELLRATFEQAAVGMAFRGIDPPRWLRVNEKLCDILGYTQEELLRLTSVDVTPPEERELAVENNRRLERGEAVAVQREKRYLRKDGASVWVDIAASIIRDAEGRPLHLLSVIDDITERKRAENALRDHQDRLEQLVSERTRELSIANREMEAFVYSVSHDLRAPLRGIDGFTSRVVERAGPALDAESRGYLQRVRAAAQRMGMIMSDLLALSRVMRTGITRTRVDLTGIARSVAADLSRTAPARRVEWRIADGLAAEADPGLARLALENLLGNAWKYTGRTDAAVIELAESGRHGDQVEFCVRDNGAGFDMAYADLLFQPFKRLHGQHEFEGTGVGLASVHRVIERHGGTVRGEGEVGRGAAFYFTLPGCERT